MNNPIKLKLMASLLFPAFAVAAVQEIGPWQVESLSDDFSFSALGSMVAMERGFDPAAGVPPNLLIIGCDGTGHAITIKTPREGFHEKKSGQEALITVSVYFDADPPLEQTWSLFGSGPWVGAEAPSDENETWFEGLGRASSVKLNLGGNLEAHIADRVVEFDVGDFPQAFGSLVCGEDSQ